jgi:hypothetical protein
VPAQADESDEEVIDTAAPAQTDEAVEETIVTAAHAQAEEPGELSDQGLPPDGEPAARSESTEEHGVPLGGAESGDVAVTIDPALAEAEAAEKLRAAQEHDRLAGENATRLEREIETLRGDLGKGTQREFRSFFEHERNLHGLFKELRPLHAADRHRLWNQFKQIGAEARRQQQEEWESRRYQSIEARETVDEKIRDVENLMQGAPGAREYRRADALLNEVRALLASSAPGSPGQVLIGPDRRACWDRWRAVRDALRQQRGGLQEQDYQNLAGLVAAVVESARGDDPFKAVERVKELQALLGKAYLRRGQFEELRRRLSEAWQAAQARITEQRQERTKRRVEWRERMEGHLTRWRETLEHRRSQHEHLLQQLAKLEGMEKNARSDDFAVQVRGWKDETTEKMRRVGEFIADLEERIASATRKLGSRGSREPVAGEPASGPGRERESASPRDESVEAPLGEEFPDPEDDA